MHWQLWHRSSWRRHYKLVFQKHRVYTILKNFYISLFHNISYSININYNFVILLTAGRPWRQPHHQTQLIKQLTPHLTQIQTQSRLVAETIALELLLEPLPCPMHMTLAILSTILAINTTLALQALLRLTTMEKPQWDGIRTVSQYSSKNVQNTYRVLHFRDDVFKKKR